MSTSTNSPAAPKASNYINLHTTGIGYLGRVREVSVKKGQPFMACSIRAMSGEKGVKDGIQYTPFDVKAVTAQAAGILRDAIQDTNNPDKRVTVQFLIADSQIAPFKYDSGPKAGETGVTMKGRLLQIQRVWVKDLTLQGEEQTGNVLVYEYKPESKPADAEAPSTAQSGDEE